VKYSDLEKLRMTQHQIRLALLAFAVGVDGSEIL
jgi:hypothetical protein